MSWKGCEECYVTCHTREKRKAVAPLLWREKIWQNLRLGKETFFSCLFSFKVTTKTTLTNTILNCTLRKNGGVDRELEIDWLDFFTNKEGQHHWPPLWCCKTLASLNVREEPLCYWTVNITMQNLIFYPRIKNFSIKVSLSCTLVAWQGWHAVSKNVCLCVQPKIIQTFFLGRPERIHL